MMDAKTPADILRDLGVAQRARISYTSMERNLDWYASELVKGKKLREACKARYRAAICRRAARAEFTDTLPEGLDE